MRGIVVEINRNSAVVLSDDGLFQTVRNEKYEIGQAVKVQTERKTMSKLVATAAGVAAAFAICTIGAFAYFTPTDYVSLDVNPSVEYSVNMFDRILDVKAVNDDGEEILSGLSLDNMTIEAAVKATLGRMIKDGYITDDPDAKVVITTSNDKLGKAKQLAAELEQEVRTYLDSREGITVDVEAEAVRLEKVQEARELGVTPGKLNLVEKLQASTSSAINKEEWLTMPVKEINKAIKENRKSEREKARKYDRDNEQPEQDGAAETGADLTEYEHAKPDKTRPNGQDIQENSQDGKEKDWQRDQNKDSKEYRDQGIDWKDTDPDEDIEEDPGERPTDEDRPGNSGNKDKKKKQPSHN